MTTRKPVITFKQINALAIPAIIAGIVEPLLSITDTAIVGNIKINPTESLAAVGIAGSLISALIWILAQSRSAISATIARYYGAEKIEDIHILPAQVLSINLILSLIVYVISITFAESIFKMYNADGLLLNYTIQYYNIRAIGLPFTLLTFSIFGVFRGLQNTFWPMVISIIGAVLNVGLDYLLVFGVEGFIEPMHIEGAAIASVIAQITMSVLAFVFMLWKTPFRLKLIFPLHKEVKQIVIITINLFLRALSLNIALYMANAYATSYGEAHIAAQTIAFQIWLFFAFFIDGYSSVGNIVSGKLLGQGNYNGLAELSRIISKYAIVISIILAVLFFALYKPIGEMFTDEQDVLKLFYDVFWIVILMQPLNAIAFVFDGIFKGMADATTLRNTLIIATFIGFVPTLLLGDYFHYELYGIWLAFTVWMLFRAGILIWKFKTKILTQKITN
ncbi:MATE family efflux transporter [Aureivirga sp. CE67]|uniref:MATE family efflux transporter n=1 Tax=Aureivirga sp. CE67 TaxID=1788983 RepID=UPI0018CB5A6B|nr:MATE family efflux transporter [Aureivirga sp. CE67]